MVAASLPDLCQGCPDGIANSMDVIPLSACRIHAPLHERRTKQNRFFSLSPTLFALSLLQVPMQFLHQNQPRFLAEVSTSEVDRDDTGNFAREHNYPCCHGCLQDCCTAQSKYSRTRACIFPLHYFSIALHRSSTSSILHVKWSHPPAFCNLAPHFGHPLKIFSNFSSDSLFSRALSIAVACSSSMRLRS